MADARVELVCLRVGLSESVAQPASAWYAYEPDVQQFKGPHPLSQYVTARGRLGSWGTWPLVLNSCFLQGLPVGCLPFLGRQLLH